ncbi:MAG: DUF4190 domain-containing protein [Planctomycetota bacterium]
MSNPYESSNLPPQVQTPGGTPFGNHSQGDGTGGLIPYKNPKALTAYYLGILSCLCCFFGLPVGIAPIVLGFQGLKAQQRDPIIKGTVHAWIGIVLGIISTLGACFFAVAILSGIISSRR